MRLHDPVRLAVLVAMTAAVLAAVGVDAQTFTMNKECRAQVESANQMNDAESYTEALAAFDALVEECGTKDGREAIQVGRAHALNGLGRHTEAIDAANAALEVSKDTSLFGYFERAYAEEQMGDMAAATADYDRIIELTEMNQNVAERATVYAKVADLNAKAGKTAEAEAYLAKAIELDPGNPEFLVLQGDWAARAGDYDAAFAAYDRAVAAGATGVTMYQIRAEARLSPRDVGCSSPRISSTAVVSTASRSSTRSWVADPRDRRPRSVRGAGRPPRTQ